MAVRRLLVAGRYRLHEPVGSGGMGRVWLARDEMLDRDVAVKEFLPPEWMSDTERDRLRDRTLREARSAARLSHPHVVRIYDVVHADELPWIVMEYVASRSLHQVIAEDGPLVPGSVARLGLDLLDALTAAHHAGVLHRDVKPHNVLMGHDGRVVLTDFGLATFVDDGSVTGPGVIVGSPQYVSPERARDGTSTVESDLWSLGATLYAAVEGQSPYARDSAMATLMALATEPPQAPVRAGALKPVLIGLLRRDPADRLTPAEIESGLRAVAGNPPRRRHPPPRPRALTDNRRLPGPPVNRAAGRATVPAQRAALETGPAPNSAPVPVADPAVTVRPKLGVTASPDGVLALPAAPAVPRPPAVPDIASLPVAELSDRADVAPGPAAGAAAGPPPDRPGASGQWWRRQTTGQALVPTMRHREHGPDDNPEPAGAGPRRSHLLPALAGALLVALLAGGGGLMGRLGQRDDVPGAIPASSASAPADTGGTGAGVGGFSPSTCHRPVGPGSRRTPLPGAVRTAPHNGRAALPGWSYHRDGTGFVVAVPDGWTYERVGTTVCFADPRGVRVLSIDTDRRPTADPVVACRREAQRLERIGALPGYAEVGITRVPYLSKAADWEYRYDDARGDRMHATTRWFTSGGKAFALGWVTSESAWQVNRANLVMILSSFDSPPV